MVIRVTGRCDNFEVVFSPAGPGRWEAAVPADTEDGKYAAEIRATAADGRETVWTGFLYILDSRPIRLEFVRRRGPYEALCWNTREVQKNGGA